MIAGALRREGDDELTLKGRIPPRRARTRHPPPSTHQGLDAVGAVEGRMRLLYAAQHWPGVGRVMR